MIPAILPAYYATSLYPSNCKPTTTPYPLHIGLTLPARCIHREAHLYGFTWDHGQAASPSTYIGSVTL